MNDIFDKNKTYVIGVLTTTGLENPTSPTPTFRTRPKEVAIKGSNLYEEGIKTISDYLKKNPHNYPVNNTLHFYQEDPATKNLELFGRGNPFPNPEKDGENLADKPIAQQSFAPPPQQNYNSDLIELYKQQINNLNESIKLKEFKIEELQNKIVSKDEEMLNLRAENRTLEIENEKLKGALEGYIERFGGNSGLSDANVVSGFAKLADAASGILSQEPIQQLIAGFGAKFLGNKFNIPIQETPQPQPLFTQQQPQQQNFQEYQERF